MISSVQTPPPAAAPEGVPTAVNNNNVLGVADADVQPNSGHKATPRFVGALLAGDAGKMHLKEIADWAINKTDMRLVDGKAIIGAFLADRSNALRHATFLRLALTKHGSLAATASAAEVERVVGAAHQGWSRTAPKKLMMIVDKMI